MSAPHDNPKNVPLGGISDSESNEPNTGEEQSLEQLFNKREPRIQEEDLDATDVYQKMEEPLSDEDEDPLSALDELADSESSSFTPTPPKVNVTRLDPSLVYSGAVAAAGVASLEEKSIDEDENVSKGEGEEIAGTEEFEEAEEAEEVEEAEEAEETEETEIEDGEQSEVAVDSEVMESEESDDDWISRMSEKVKEAADEDIGVEEKVAEIALPQVGYMAPNNSPDEPDVDSPDEELESESESGEAVDEDLDSSIDLDSSREDMEGIEATENTDYVEEALEAELPEVGFRAPNVTPVLLSWKDTYGQEVEEEASVDLETEELDSPGVDWADADVESDEEIGDLDESVDPELPEVGFRAPKVTPVMLDRDKIYSGNDSDSEAVEEITQPEVDEKPAELDDLEERIATLKSTKVEEMEVMKSEKIDSTSLSQSGNLEKPISKWAFWRRPSKRDQQLARISEGYLEMVDLVRAIRSQLETQNENNLILRDSLSHLPEAMKGLDSFSESQHTVGEALKEIHGEMQSYSAKDEKLAESMIDFNDTLKGIDGTSKATMQTFDRVQERMRDSDIRMENLFQNVQNTEEKVSDTMVRLQRNMAVMQYIFLFCLMIVIGVLVFTLAGKKDEKNEPAPVQKIILETPAAPASSGVTPEANNDN